MATPPQYLLPDKHACTCPGRPVFSQNGWIEVTQGGLVGETGLAGFAGLAGLAGLAGHVLKVAGTESGRMAVGCVRPISTAKQASTLPPRPALHAMPKA